MLRKWYVNASLASLVVVGLSWLSYAQPSWLLPIWISLLVVIFVASCYRLLFGVAAVVGELVIGSQGHIIGQARLGLFVVLLLATLVWIIRERHIAVLHTRYWKWYVGLVLVLALASVTALWHGNDPKTIFLDANGYLFLAMIVPFTQAIRSAADLKKLLAVFWAGLTVLFVETLLILFAFSHDAAFHYYLTDLYRWLRDFRLAEISPQGNQFIRIFFQSHLYVLFGFIAASIQFITQPVKRWARMFSSGLIGLTLLLLFISYSRSFWVATLAIMIVLSYLAYQRGLFWKYFSTVLVTSALGYGLVLGLVNVPLFGSGAGVGAGNLLTDRTSDLTTDAGGGSRLALLWPLTWASLQHPLLGSGLGTMVSYATKDARALATSDDGLYTTYAFEWGYLDLWLKFGLVGALLYVSIVLALAIRLWYQREHYVAYVASLGLLALGIVHALTPYLNHPLGIGWVILATSIAIVYDRAHR